MQPRPRREHRLVRQLDRRRAGPGIAIEGELAGSSVRVEHGRHRLLIDVQRRDLRARHPAPRVLGPLPERDEAQEQLPSSFLAVVVELLVELLGSSPERAGHTADLAIRLEEQDPAVAPLEELRERVLHQRERPGLLRDVGEHLGDEPGLQRHVDAFRRPGDRAFDLLPRERDHGFDARLEQLREAPIQQRPVVEVGPQRDDDADAAARIRGGGLDAPEELGPGCLVLHQREHFLELVDHEDELASVRGEQTEDRAVEALLIARELVHHARRGVRRGAKECRLEPVQGVCAREHVSDVPPLRSGDRAAPEGGDQAGAHDR